MTDNARESRRRRKGELALRALGEKGNPKAAARWLGISVRTLNDQISEYCRLEGFDTPEAAAYWLDRSPVDRKNSGTDVGSAVSDH